MKRVAYLIAIILLFTISCKKESILPDCQINTFSLIEFPDITFTINTSTDPATISNDELFMFDVDLKSVTLRFSLLEEGSLWSVSEELFSESSVMDLSSPVIFKTIGTDGIIDKYYILDLNIKAPDAPKIESLSFDLNPNHITPLAGLLELELSTACTLQIIITGQDQNDFIKTWNNPSTSFSVPVIGLYPDFQNEVVVRITDGLGLINQERMYIHTDPLPEDYPELEIIENKPSKAEPGFYLVELQRLVEGITGDRQNFISMIDQYGKVRWLYRGSYDAVFQRMYNGNWLVGINHKLVEMNMLGKKLGLEIEVPGFHHDAIELPGGNILALGDYEDSFEDAMFEFDRLSGYMVREWDFRTILDTARPKNPGHPNPIDWFHNNAVTYDSIDHAFILSGRNQSALVKIDYASDEIVWILSNHENWGEEFQKYLLTPIGDNFEWPWGQHAPMLSYNTNSRLICFDNGSNRSWTDPLDPMENYSRGVEYEIDEANMQIRQLWEYGKVRQHELFSAYISDADYLPVTDNRLLCFGGILKNLNGEAVDVFDPETNRVSVAKNEIRLIEVSFSGEVVFEMRVTSEETNLEGFRSYRAKKVPLYPVPVQ